MKRFIAFMLGIFSITYMFLYVAGFVFDDGFHVYFLDIGQGDSILIQTPYHQYILVDGGPDGSVMGQLAEVLPFWQRDLDMLILTHPDKDHVAGLNAVLDKYRVGKVVFSGVRSDSYLYKSFLEKIARNNVPFDIADGTFDMEVAEGITLDFIYPLRSLAGTNIAVLNNSSVVCRLLYGDFSLFLSGDAELPVEEEILNTDLDLHANMLKVAHHGSLTSSSIGILSAISPRVAVIQVGQNNRYNHPRPEIIQRLAGIVQEMYRNDLNGRVRVDVDGLNGQEHEIVSQRQPFH